MGTQERICRLCLKLCDNHFAVEGDMKDVLDLVLPKIDLARIQELVICIRCSELLTKCFDFKVTCLNTYDYVVLLVNKNKVNLKDVYRSKNENDTVVLVDQDICGFCMRPVENCSAISLDVVKGDDMLKQMVEQFLPELDLSIIKKPVICVTCHESLGNCFHFVTNCLIVEEKIKKYRETLDLNRKSRIDLHSLLQFTSEVDSNSVDIIKGEKQFCDESENAKENIICKNKRVMDADDSKFNNEQQCSSLLNICKEENKLDAIKIEDIFSGENKSEVNEGNFGMEDQQFLVKEEIEIKTDEQDVIRFNDGVVLPQPEVTTKLCKIRRCSMPNPKENLSSTKHTSANEEVAIYKCEFCPHQTIRKQCLKAHLLVHKDPSEVTMYKCDYCSFQSKHKVSAKTHLLKHKDPSDLTMYKCNSCSFQTKRKSYLFTHFLTHKDPSEVTMYKCNWCSYQAKYKGHLKRHLLIHESPSKVTLYNCDSCSYQTDRKGSLKTHLLAHKVPSEVTIYRCDSCSFQTTHKSYLNRHLLLHKNPSEITMYSCDSCSYQTKRKAGLKSHLRVHKDPSEVTVYKCDSCLFQTKHKNSLKTHLQLHKASSEVVQ